MSSEVKEARKALKDFLEQNPHLKQTQVEIELALANLPVEDRLAYLFSRMSTNITHLQAIFTILGKEIEEDDNE